MAVKTSEAQTADKTPEVQTHTDKAPTVECIEDTKKTSVAARQARRANVPRRQPVNSCWAERYRPTSSSELVGNQYAIKQLTQWVSLRKRNIPSETVALLWGSPGVGKTTAAHVLLTEAGFAVEEVNASDSNTGDRLLTIMNTKMGRRPSGKLVALVFDEIDGMYSDQEKKPSDGDSDDTRTDKDDKNDDDDASEEHARTTSQMRRPSGNQSKSHRVCKRARVETTHFGSDDFGMAQWIDRLSRLPPTAAPIILVCNELKRKHVRVIKASSWCKVVHFSGLFASDAEKRLKQVLLAEQRTGALGANSIERIIEASGGDKRVDMRHAIVLAQQAAQGGLFSVCSAMDTNGDDTFLLMRKLLAGSPTRACIEPRCTRRAQYAPDDSGVPTYCCAHARGMKRADVPELAICSDAPLVRALVFHNYAKNWHMSAHSSPEEQVQQLDELARCANLQSHCCAMHNRGSSGYTGILLQQYFKAKPVCTVEKGIAEWPKDSALLTWRDKPKQFGVSSMNSLVVMPIAEEASLWRACMAESDDAHAHLDAVSMACNLKDRAYLDAMRNAQDLGQ